MCGRVCVCVCARGGGGGRNGAGERPRLVGEQESGQKGSIPTIH